MVSHTSAPVREETPHANRTTRTAAIINVLKERAEATLNDESLDAKSRAVLRYALETNDPWLARLIRRADDGDNIVNAFGRLETEPPQTQRVENKHDASNENKIEALAEIICGGGDESPAALLVLMNMLEKSSQPSVLANTVKHYAFTRCGELNVFGMVDAQIGAIESELFAELS